MYEMIRRAALVSLLIAASVATAAAQADGGSGDSIVAMAAQRLREGRGNEARILLLRAMRESTDPTQKAEYRLRLGQADLYDGQYDEASRAFSAMLTRGNAPANSDLTRQAHHGLALVEAFNSRSARAAAHYAQALQGRTLRDSIEMLVMTNQNDSAQKALDRLAASNAGKQDPQYLQDLRGLSWMMAGHCTQALPAIAKAPQQDLPIPVAVRGRCAAKHGQRVPGLALRDSVLQQPDPDPFSWTTLIARDAARKIE
jgi:tetratricopeptide (TPR) repeat protein